MSTSKRRVPAFTEKDLELVEEKLREMLGPQLMELAESYGIDVGESLRLSVLTDQLVCARERLGLTLEEAAARLRVPQYRLRDVESGRRRLLQEVLVRYIEFLGLQSESSAWAAQCPDLASRLGLTSGEKTEADVQRICAARRRGSM
jgi:plasmid maintenance system antidote protein VapI